MNIKNIALVAFAAVLLSACKSAQEQRADVSTGPATFTLGKVQGLLRQGMAQDQVISALGSPNIVTTDGQNSETWVYDKISSEGASSVSSGGFIFVGGATGAHETTQKTLTVMIKFDQQKRIKSIDYHQSKF